MTLFPYQRPHAERLSAALHTFGVAADISDTGTGKTAVALALAAACPLPVVVVCPASVRPSWRATADEFGVSIEVVSYQHAIRNMVKKTKYGTTGSRLEWLNPPGLLIFDEAHYLKGQTSLQSKLALAAKRQGVPQILLLSATLIGEPTDLKAIGWLLGLHSLTDFYRWCTDHACYQSVWGGLKFSETLSKRFGAMSRISHKLHGKVFAMKRADIPDFPQTQISTLLIPDEDLQAEKLSEDIRKLEALRGKQAEDAELPIVEILRKRQQLELLKVPSLIEIARNAAEHSKVAIFVNFNETRDALCGALSADGPTGSVYGGQAEGRRAHQVQAFQNDELRYLIINIRAGGAGISLHNPTAKTERTSIICPNYSAVDLKQVLGRPHRVGGGFSRQLVALFDNPTERRIKKILDARMNDLDTISNADLSL